MTTAAFRRARAGAILGSVVFSLGLAGCGEEQPPAVLQVGQVGYSEVELGALSSAQRAQLSTLTAFGVLTALNELPRIWEPFREKEIQSRTIRKLTREVALIETGYDDMRLRSLYQAAPEYELTVRHLVVLSERWRPEEQRVAAAARAAAALREVQAGADFATVAANYSEEPGAARRGGLLEPGRRGTWVAEFWEAASALDIGAVSSVVETPYGYHLILLENRDIVPFDEVRDQVLGRLVDLKAATPQAEAWAARETASLRVDEQAAMEWRSGEDTAETILASWPNGAYRGEELQRYLLTLEPDAIERITTAERATFLEVIRALARNALLAQRASELGVTLSENERKAIAEPGLAQLRGLAEDLNFRSGASVPAIKAAALDALAPRNQAAQIAQGKVLILAPVLRDIIPQQ